MPDGAPVLYCHVFPGSRLDGAVMEDAAHEVGARLIAMDRPGFGLSDFQPERTIRDWPSDLAALANHLELERFALLGVSGGGPYAMATAVALGARVTRLALVCGLGRLADPDSTSGMNPIQAGLIQAARRAPRITLGFNTWITGPFMHHFPGIALHTLTATAPVADREVLADPAIRRALLATAREAFRRGGRGAAWELYLFTHRWDLDPGAVATPTLLWHGEADATVPVAMGRRHAELIPRCQAHFLPDEGHFSLPIRHAAEILEALVNRR